MEPATGKRSYISEIQQYRHAGHLEFDAQSRDLREHMRAAHAAFQAPPLPNPNETGSLPSDVAANLWPIMQYVGTNWNISSSSTLTQEDFADFLALKTTQTPSYLTAYTQANQLFLGLITSLGSQAAALAYLYTPAPANPPPNWDVARSWVVQEFINLYVSQGAFRAYGWKLYPGFAGGPFDDPANLPYRPIPNGN